VFPRVEPPDGFASVVPFAVLQRFHQMTDEELRPYPQLLEAAHTLRRNAQASAAPAHETVTTAEGTLGTGPSGPQTAPSLSDTPRFHGTLQFVRLTFIVWDSSTHLQVAKYVVSDADLATIIQYTELAVPAMCHSTARYGESQVSVEAAVLDWQVNVTLQNYVYGTEGVGNDLVPQVAQIGKYTKDTLEQWLMNMATFYGLGLAHTCLVVCNPVAFIDGVPPVGVINTDADPQYYGGYHLTIHDTYPYCVVNVNTFSGSNLTIKDADNHFALALSHEVTEMIVNPYARDDVPEVCDPCAGCDNLARYWRAFFVVRDGQPCYVQSDDFRSELPFLAFDFYIAAVALPLYVQDAPCPPCAFGPDARESVSPLLLFFEEADAYFELYSVNAAGEIALQTTSGGIGFGQPLPPGTIGQHPHPPTPAGAIDPQNPVVEGGSRSLIVPGYYTTKPSGWPMDVLFYAPSSSGSGPNNSRFFSTGSLGELVASNWGWPGRGDWTQIIPGHFSQSPTTDVLFYERTSGTGEFYHTGGGLVLPPFARYTDWRTTWTQIIPGRFSESPYTDLMFYEPASGTVEFYHTGGGLASPRFATYSGLPTTVSQIIPGKFSDSRYTDLVFCDPSRGIGEFYHTNGEGLVLPPFATFSDVNTWELIIPGRFSQRPTTDVLFYDAQSGTGVFYHTDGGGLVVPPFATYTDWRTTWSVIASLSQ
jgi:hypothetical protein